jgi:hypothetical protein
MTDDKIETLNPSLIMLYILRKKRFSFYGLYIYIYIYIYIYACMGVGNDSSIPLKGAI